MCQHSLVYDVRSPAWTGLKHNPNKVKIKLINHKLRTSFCKPLYLFIHYLRLPQCPLLLNEAQSHNDDGIYFSLCICAALRVVCVDAVTYGKTQC